VATVDAAHGQAPILEVSVFQSRIKQMLPLGCELEDLLAGCCLHNLCESQRFSLVLAGWVEFGGFRAADGARETDHQEQDRQLQLTEPA